MGPVGDVGKGGTKQSRRLLAYDIFLLTTLSVIALSLSLSMCCNVREVTVFTPAHSRCRRRQQRLGG